MGKARGTEEERDGGGREERFILSTTHNIMKQLRDKLVKLTWLAVQLDIHCLPSLAR